MWRRLSTAFAGFRYGSKKFSRTPSLRSSCSASRWQICEVFYGYRLRQLDILAAISERINFGQRSNRMGVFTVSLRTRTNNILPLSSICEFLCRFSSFSYPTSSAIVNVAGRAILSHAEETQRSSFLHLMCKKLSYRRDSVGRRSVRRSRSSRSLILVPIESPYATSY